MASNGTLAISETPGRVTLKFPTDRGEATFNMPAVEMAKLGLALLHHSAKANGLEIAGQASESETQSVLAHLVEIRSVGETDHGVLALECVTRDGLSFHLAIEQATALSLVQILASHLPLDQLKQTRQ